MCAIVDANRFGVVFSSPPGDDYTALVSWLTDADGILVYGGTKYSDEMRRHGAAQRFFARLRQAGRAILIEHATVDAEETRLKGRCVSDDEHVIALARASGARIVCTEDRNLFADVKDPDLLSKPRGRIYRTHEHVHLLHHDPCCVG